MTTNQIDESATSNLTSRIITDPYLQFHAQSDGEHHKKSLALDLARSITNQPKGIFIKTFESASLPGDLVSYTSKNAAGGVLSLNCRNHSR